MEIRVGTLDSGRIKKDSDPWGHLANNLLNDAVEELTKDDVLPVHKIDAYLFLTWEGVDYWEELAHRKKGVLSNWVIENFELYYVSKSKNEVLRVRWRKGKKEEWYAKQNGPTNIL